MSMEIKAAARLSSARSTAWDIAVRTWSRISHSQSARMLEGDETCFTAVYLLGKELELRDVDFNCVDGELHGQGHWWIESQGFILDLGDNVTPMLKGYSKVVLSIYPLREKVKRGYTTDHELSYSEFSAYRRSIGRS